MTSKKYLKLISGAGLLFMLLLFIAVPAARTYAQGGVNRETAATGTAFTYQGYLEKSGSGVTDTCSFNFALYDALTGGVQVGSTVSKSGVAVSNGKFTAELDFGSSAFDGDARYLDIQVQCTGDASMVALSPRTALNGTPYALSLRPGVTVQGSDATGRIFGAVNNDTTGSNAAIYGESKSAAGAGISGWNTNSGGGYGIYGNSTASSGTPYGVYGIASDAGSATSYGVYGESKSSVGTGVGGKAPTNGVYGEATNTTGSTWGVYGKSASAGGYGVYGNNTASSGSPYGIYGIASDTGSATSYGVYGESKSSVGTGVGGISPQNGVYGEASNTSGTTWGVYGKSASASGYGVYGNNTANSGSPYGIYGIASDTGSVTSYGVYGESKSSVGTGVGGISPQNGIYGEATSSGINYGVYGKSTSASGYGVYSNGNAHVEGMLTWKVITSYISIPGSAFVPRNDTYAYHHLSSGGGIAPDNSPSNQYFAAAQLPHGATVTKFTFYWADSSNANAQAGLYRTDLQGGETTMASVSSSGGSGSNTVTASTATTSIASATVDNSLYSYYLYFDLPTDGNGDTIIAYGVTIEYTITQPY